ncbi:MAG: ATP-binding cassette domain-containing protein [Microbacterium sp.]|uniref:ABC transporter ATP-binding protein n=1 Tax=Microbacterium sp. TaxID=51671 RepID=UPI002717D810|nr:ATP-binding cassette domain-containing protein [Microbacterium sp.]MDO8382839.1 ATP-binding cassette domain-containing protein [Microbacterium sp.]
MNEFHIEGVTKVFRSGPRAFRAVDGVDLTVAAGVRTGLVGESGSGKSTLARMLVSLERPSGGRISYGGQDVSRLIRSSRGRLDFRRRVQFVAQDTSSSFNPRATLHESVTRPARRLLRLTAAQADHRAAELYDLFELPSTLSSRRPRDVSGGQRQRFSIARSLVVRPEMLVCDEAVSALDVSVQGAVLNHLKEYSESTGCGILFVSHGLPATAFLCTELIVMRNGEIVEAGPTDRLLDAPAHPYTAQLLRAYGDDRSAVPA